jgi:hypothetical protein
MGWFSWLGTKEKTVDDIFDKDNGLLTQVGDWVGGMSYTEEEAAEAKERLNAGVFDFVQATLTESTSRSRTRRTLANTWIKSQLAMIFITMMVAPFDMELAAFYLGIAFGTLMLSGTLAVLAFFFGSHLLRTHGVGSKGPDK